MSGARKRNTKSDRLGLESVGIFAGLDGEDLEALRSLMSLVHHAAGELVFAEGEAGDRLFVLVEGAVSIGLHAADGDEILVSKVQPGGFFGEMAIFDRAPRSASCRCTEPSLLLSLSAAEFAAFSRERPRAASGIMQKMLGIQAARLLDTGSLASQMVQWGEAARRRAVTDEATGLFNRRFLDDSLEGLFSRARLEGAALSLAMFDLDHFGDLNKARGQEFGDMVIVELSKTFRKAFREGDILVRYGGDEFTFVLPGADPEVAEELCSGACRLVRELRLEAAPELRLTASIGYASFPAHASSVENLAAAADAALYRAKESGRDRTAGPTADVAGGIAGGERTEAP